MSPKLRRLLLLSVLLPFLLAAAAPAPRWHSVEIARLGFRISVPVYAPRLEGALHVTEDPSPSLPTDREAQVRIRNYSEDELIQGEVPSLRQGQFWIDVFASRRPAPPAARLQADCTGKIFPLPHGTGAWCAYDPERLEGEGSVTHIGWTEHEGRLYRTQLDARGLAPGMAERILRSLQPIALAASASS